MLIPATLRVPPVPRFWGPGRDGGWPRSQCSFQPHSGCARSLAFGDRGGTAGGHGPNAHSSHTQGAPGPSLLETGEGRRVATVPMLIPATLRVPPVPRFWGPGWDAPTGQYILIVRVLAPNSANTREAPPTPPTSQNPSSPSPKTLPNPFIPLRKNFPPFCRQFSPPGAQWNRD